MAPAAMLITEKRLSTLADYVDSKEDIVPVTDEEWMQIAEGDLKKDQISRNLVNNEYIRRFAKIKLSKNDRRKEKNLLRKMIDVE